MNERAPLDPSELDLIDMGGGTLLRLRVKPGARKNAVLGVHGGALKISVIAAAERGKANRGALKLLGKVFDVPPSALEMVAGQSSPDKTLLVPMPPKLLRRRLR